MTVYAEARLTPLREEAYRVTAAHWRSDVREVVGEVASAGAVGWTATAYRTPNRAGHPIGLFPDAKAAAEALLTHYGFGVTRS